MDIHDLERKVRKAYRLDEITTISELESVVKEMGIPIVDFSLTDLRVGVAIAEAIGVMFMKYPKLKHTLCAIGSRETINFYFNVLLSDISIGNKKMDHAVIRFIYRRLMEL